MRNLRDKVVVITGAASGIGRELSLCLAGEGSALALTDIDQRGLQETVGLIQGTPPRVTTHELDVSDRDQVHEVAAAIYLDHGRVDLVINNAGVSIAETLEDVSYDDFEWLMSVNFWGVVYTTKAFLPYLKQRPEAHIVNISSIDGILTIPNAGPYCASKFAVRAFTEALFQELRGTNVKVTCVLPGGVRTGIHRNARFFKTACPGMTREECIAYFERAALTSAGKAAATIVKGIRKDRSRILIGPDARFIDLVTRLMPVGSSIWMGHVMRNLKSTTFRWFRR